MDVFKVGSRDRADQWFKRYKTNSRTYFSKMIDAVQIFGILDARSEPNIFQHRKFGDNRGHAIRSFRQYLIGMARGFFHYVPNPRYEVDRHQIVKQVRHRVHENAARFAPQVRDFKRLVIQPDFSGPN